MNQLLAPSGWRLWVARFRAIACRTVYTRAESVAWPVGSLLIGTLILIPLVWGILRTAVAPRSITASQSTDHHLHTEQLVQHSRQQLLEELDVLLEVTDGVADTVLRNRAALKGPSRHTDLPNGDYQVVVYVPDHANRRAIGVAVHPETNSIVPFRWQAQQQPLPQAPTQLKLLGGRNVAATTD